MIERKTQFSAKAKRPRVDHFHRCSKCRGLFDCYCADRSRTLCRYCLAKAEVK